MNTLRRLWRAYRIIVSTLCSIVAWGLDARGGGEVKRTKYGRCKFGLPIRANGRCAAVLAQLHGEDGYRCPLLPNSRIPTKRATRRRGK